MLEKYFSAPKTLARLRSGPSGPYIDGFAEALERDSYSPLTAVRYLRAAAHFGRFLQRRSGSLAEIDASTLDAFYRHLSRCHCPSRKQRKRQIPHALRGETVSQLPGQNRDLPTLPQFGC